MRFSGWPSLNRISVGIDTTSKLRAVSGLASTSSLATVSCPTDSLAISASTGATILHGPHQVAQKSTSTGVLLANTSLSNEASETSTGEAALVIGMLQSKCRCCWGFGGTGLCTLARLCVLG